MWPEVPSHLYFQTELASDDVEGDASEHLTLIGAQIIQQDAAVLVGEADVVAALDVSETGVRVTGPLTVSSLPRTGSESHQSKKNAKLLRE